MGRMTEAEKKRRQRQRAKRGSRVVRVEIMDWEAWGEFLSDNHWLMGSATDHSVRDATRNYLWKVCSDHRKEKASQQLAEIRSPVNGLLDREIGPYEEWRLIKPKGLRREGVFESKSRAFLRFFYKDRSENHLTTQ